MIGKAGGKVIQSLSDRARNDRQTQVGWRDSEKFYFRVGGGVKELGSEKLDPVLSLGNTDVRVDSPIDSVLTSQGRIQDTYPRFKDQDQDIPVVVPDRGLFIWFDANWMQQIGFVANNSFARDLFKLKTKQLYTLSRSDARWYSLENGTYHPKYYFGGISDLGTSTPPMSGFSGSGIPNAVTFSLVESTTIPAPVSGGGYFHPLFLSTELEPDKPVPTLTAQEIERIKGWAKVGKAFIECEWGLWQTYNNYVVNALGLSSYLTSFSAEAVVTADYNPTGTNSQLARILRSSSSYLELRIDAAGFYNLGNPDSNPNAPIGIFQNAGRYCFFYVPPGFF